MFMSVTYSLKVILYVSSDGSSTTYGLRYGSLYKIWEDNQGRRSRESHISVVLQWIMTRKHDTSA
jgi:hypothetical protein